MTFATIVASIVAGFNAVKLQRSRAAALRRIRDIRKHVRASGARPAAGTTFATAKGLVWGTSKFQAVDLELRGNWTERPDNGKWVAVCTHAH